MSINLTVACQTSLAGETPITINPGTQSITKAGKGKYQSTLSVTTSEKTVSTYGELTTEGLIFVRNLDATNFVRLGFSTGVYGMKVKPGETFVFRLVPGATVYLIADTATCLVDIDVLED